MNNSTTTTRASSTLAALTLPVILAGVAWLGPHAIAASDSPQDSERNRAHGKLPHSINLRDLEARSLERFSQIDSNNDGLIDAQEYATGAKVRGKKHRRGHKNRLNSNDRAALKAELFSRLDTDKNGELSTEEFADARDVRQTLRNEQQLQHRFEKLDDNNDGQLSLTEFQRRLEKMRALDSNSDGTLSRAELREGRKEHRAAKNERNQG